MISYVVNSKESDISDAYAHIFLQWRTNMHFFLRTKNKTTMHFLIFSFQINNESNFRIRVPLLILIFVDHKTLHIVKKP